MMVGLAVEHGGKKTAMIDATYLKAYRTATSMAKKMVGAWSSERSTMDGVNTKLHAICVRQGRTLSLLETVGQGSATTSVHSRYLVADQKSTGCLGIVAVTLIGSWMH